MSYVSLARKYRPQRFEDVVGQQAVTRTLQNALIAGRLSQAFVFAGPRGCGKTTTARLLARALNCIHGPNAEPCGICDPCVEIAQGRDLDVLEIDAATHTGVDNVREVIIEGLSISPVRDRFKVFIIDEVHMLSSSSFNALLKSIEEPPPHVVFVMATTELRKIPATVLSRTQVHEFRTIGPAVVAKRLRAIADAEAIEIDDAALLVLARAGEGSLRDSLTAFDQVRAFAGERIAIDDVVGVLGLVGRDLVLDMLEAVAGEDAPAAFALVERGLERGYEPRQICRELARATRDLLLLSVDPARAADPDVAAESERDRLLSLARRASREDLLRAFDLLARSEEEIRLSEQPRYNLEMTLLRLMHLRKLVPLTELLAGAPEPPAARPAATASGSGSSLATAMARATAPSPSAGAPSPAARVAPRGPASSTTAMPAEAAKPGGPSPSAGPAPAPTSGVSARPVEPASAPTWGGPAAVPDAGHLRGGVALRSADPVPAGLRDAFLAEVKAAKVFFHNTVVAAAYRIEATPDQITFVFLPNQKVPRQQCEDARGWLEAIAEKVAGRLIPVKVNVEAAAPASPAEPAQSKAEPAAVSSEEALRTEAMSNPTVQALFEIFPVERARVEEI